jgi:GTPase
MTFKNLDPEVEEGNIEYKRKLEDNDQIRFRKLKSQMAWRLDEGKRLNGLYEAIYYLGIEDDGTISGLKHDQLNNTIAVFEKLVAQCDAEIHRKDIYVHEGGKYARMVIRKNKVVSKSNEIRVGLLGPTGSGKTTFIGTITHGNLDNGSGSSRSTVFRYDHEFENGNTSSIKYELLGYKDDNPINYKMGFLNTWEKITCEADKLVVLVDLPGNIKYLRTTIFGLIAHRPDYICILVDPHNFSNELVSHIDLCYRLEIPMILIMTKMDIVDDNDLVEVTIGKLSKLVGKKIDCLQNNLDILNNFDYFKNSIPLIKISNVTGLNLDLVHGLFVKLPNFHKPSEIKKGLTEFQVNDVVFIPDVGTVVVGKVNQGSITVGDKLLIGPQPNTKMESATVYSIHKKQIPTKSMLCGEYGSVVIKYDTDTLVTKNMMLITDNLVGNLRNVFYIILKNSEFTDLKVGLKLMVMTGNIYEPVIIKNKKQYDTNVQLEVCFRRNRVGYIVSDEYIVIRYTSNLIVGKTLVNCQ